MWARFTSPRPKLKRDGIVEIWEKLRVSLSAFAVSARLNRVARLL